MSCDIHCYAERKTPSGWEFELQLFERYQSYRLFGFLADVRNYSAVTPIAQPRGIPDDVSDFVRQKYIRWCGDAHSSSWLSVEELLAFDYGQLTEDRHITKQIGERSWNGGCTAEPGEGKKMTFREFLGSGYFTALDRLQSRGADRIVFWFDN